MHFYEERVFITGGRSHFRIPGIVADKDGYVFAFCNDRLDTVADDCNEVDLVYAVKAPGQKWSEVKIAGGKPDWIFTMGSLVYDRETDTPMCFFSRGCVSENEFADYTAEESEAKQAERDRIIARDGLEPGNYILETKDHGKSWMIRPFICQPFEYISDMTGEPVSTVSFTHGSATGIQLNTAPYTGRLLCPSRYTTGKYTSIAEGTEKGYFHNNTVYSDDHGQTWKCGGSVQPGTGEGTLIERSDGSILYNSRAYYFDQKRYLATSLNGGETFGDFRTDCFLFEEKNIGCNASFLRVIKEKLPKDIKLPDGCTSLTLFANPRSASRKNMTVCYSFDEGTTWAGCKAVYTGPSAYSSMTYNEKDGLFYLEYESGPLSDQSTRKSPYENGITIAEFDTEWLFD